MVLNPKVCKRDSPRDIELAIAGSLQLKRHTCAGVLDVLLFVSLSCEIQ